MADGRYRRAVCHDMLGHPSSIDRIASRALSEVALKARAVKDDPDPTAADLLYAAAVGADPLACRAVARTLMSRNVSAEHICDVHVPAVARRMGEDWISDTLSFSAVTIGSARLQYLVREIGDGLADELSAGLGGEPAVLLLVAPEADHTLGALVLASQLRRRGLSVRLSLGEGARAVIESMTATRFDAVFFTACPRGQPARPRADPATRSREVFPAPPPFVLGGAVLELEGPAAAIAGVGLVTNDVDEALGFCGLTTTVMLEC